MDIKSGSLYMHSSVAGTMAEDMYAAVDMAKKKKKPKKSSTAAERGDFVLADSTYSMVTASETPATYAAVDKTRKNPKQHQKELLDTYDAVERKRKEKVTPEMLDTTYSTLDMSNAVNALTTKNTPAVTSPAAHKGGNMSSTKKLICACAIIIAAVAIVIVFIYLVVLFYQTAAKDQSIASVEKTITSLSSRIMIQESSYRELRFTLDLIRNATSFSLQIVHQDLEHISAEISSLQAIHVELAQNITVESARHHFPFHLADSCAALPPSSPSGYYWLTALNGVYYCHMTSLCSIAGPWMRAAYLNLTDNGQQCPSGLEQRTLANNTVTCGIRGEGRGCSTVYYPINTIYPHTQVCGKVFGRVIGSPDGFNLRYSGIRLNDNYVDGVSPTHLDLCSRYCKRSIHLLMCTRSSRLS